MARTRERRRRNIAIAKVRLGPVERKKFIALGYLGSDVSGHKGPAFDVAAEAYLSDKLAEDPLQRSDCRQATFALSAAGTDCPDLWVRDDGVLQPVGR